MVDNGNILKSIVSILKYLKRGNSKYSPISERENPTPLCVSFHMNILQVIKNLHRELYIKEAGHICIYYSCV